MSDFLVVKHALSKSETPWEVYKTVLTTLPLEKYFCGERGVLEPRGKKPQNIKTNSKRALCMFRNGEGWVSHYCGCYGGSGIAEGEGCGYCGVMVILMMLPSNVPKARKGWKIIHPSLHSGMQISSLMPANLFPFLSIVLLILTPQFSFSPLATSFQPIDTANDVSRVAGFTGHTGTTAGCLLEWPGVFPAVVIAVGRPQHIPPGEEIAYCVIFNTCQGVTLI